MKVSDFERATKLHKTIKSFEVWIKLLSSEEPEHLNLSSSIGHYNGSLADVFIVCGFSKIKDLFEKELRKVVDEFEKL